MMFDHASFIFRIAMCSVLCLLSSCKESEETLSYLESLKKRTLEQLVFVEGGTFMMGDVGYVDENGVQRSFTNDPDTRPVHQVTQLAENCASMWNCQTGLTTAFPFDSFEHLQGPAGPFYEGIAHEESNQC